MSLACTAHVPFCCCSLSPAIACNITACCKLRVFFARADCASNPAASPDNTSPMPAVAIPGLPAPQTKVCCSVMTMDPAPFSSQLPLNFSLKLDSALSLSCSTLLVSTFNNLAASPLCGVYHTSCCSA